MKGRSDMRNAVSMECLRVFGTNPQTYNQASIYYRKNVIQAKKLIDITSKVESEERPGGQQDMSA